MSDKNITALPSAGALTDADIFHVSQSFEDKKVTLSAMESKFSKVDIYGLTETLSPTTAMFVAVGVDGTIANNKKVSLEKLGQVVQDESLFAIDEDIDSDDGVPFRKDGSNTLSQCTVSALSNRVMTLPDLANSLTPTTIVDTDYGVIYDTSASEPKKINFSDLRQSVFKNASLSSLTTPDNDDTLYVYDTSATSVKKITYSNLFNYISSNLPFDDRLSSTSSDIANGLIDFQAGIKTNTIVPSSGTDVTLTGKLTVNDEVVSTTGSFDNVYGRVFGRYGGISNYIDSVSSVNKFVIHSLELSPTTDNTTSLGTSSSKYKDIYTHSLSTESIISTSVAYLPYDTRIRNSGDTSDIALMNVGDTINPNLLPPATDSTQGTVELSTLLELQENSISALSQVITSGLLAQCIKLPNTTPYAQTVITGATTADSYVGSVLVGGLLINFGRVVCTHPTGAAQYVQVYIDMTNPTLNGKAYSNTDYAVFLTCKTGATATYSSIIDNATYPKTNEKFVAHVVGEASTYVYGASKTLEFNFITIGKA